MLYAVILAGGKGERFWPYSRQKCPKQFLKLMGSRSMLQQTVDRLCGLVEVQETFVITGLEYLELVREQLPELPPENIISEPVGRDTAAAVGLGALYVSRRSADGVMLVLPADHYIRDEESFRWALSAAGAAAARGEHLVTLGIQPNRPETGYGYIKQGSLHDTYASVTAYFVEKFTEKPGFQEAMKYLASGEYLWNSGMFIWRVDLIRSLINELLPELDYGLHNIEKALDRNALDEVKEIYPGLPKISIDYGIMEKAGNVLVIPGDFGWDDVGSWTALGRHYDVDEQNNVVDARGVFLDTNDCLISSSKAVATLGVDNLIVVDNEDSILVCHKDRAQEIKEVVQALKNAGYGELI
ncbi:MAG: NTP transferase domain-containing protein [Clostridiales bacterium]|nr:NTP transferase domain-containing protein [Clostridiales bacterium]MCF8023841.1 NTP transferase domain-containing protein [Clostridiales bacterium]